MRLIIFCFSILLGAYFAILHAEEIKSAVSDDKISQCRENTDRMSRLECFDTLFNTPRASALNLGINGAAPIQPLASAFRLLALEQERLRAPEITGWVTRMKPWREDMYFMADNFADILKSAVNQEPAHSANKHEWTPRNTDVFLTMREADISANATQQKLEQKAILMLTCENDITGIYVTLPRAVDDARSQVALSSDRGTNFRLKWRDLDKGDVILAGRGLESIDVIKAIASFKRIQLQINYPDGPRAFTFEVGDLSRKLDPLRQSCHW